MGYYTQYSLEILNNETDVDIINELRQCDDNAKYAIDKFGNTINDCKWYDHEKALIEFSKRYPDVIFKLEGLGEEPSDIWNKYFKNGKMQRCNAVITIEPFDDGKFI